MCLLFPLFLNGNVYSSYPVTISPLYVGYMEGQIGFFFSTGGEKLLKELYLRKSTAPAPDFDDEMLDFKQIL